MSPIVLTERYGLHYFFWASEPGEPCHVHVGHYSYDKASAKFWIKGTFVEVATCGNLSNVEIRRAQKYIAGNVMAMSFAWEEWQERRAHTNKICDLHFD